MKKLAFLLISVIFISAMFAFPFNIQNDKPLNYQDVWQKLKNIEVSDPATYTGTIKEVYIQLDTKLSKSRIILDTDEGTEVEIYIGPMWKFFDFKPGMKVEFQAVEIKLNEKISFNLAFKASSNGITVEIPYKEIFRKKLELMKRFALQKRMYEKMRFQRAPMYQNRQMMPFYGNPYGNPYGYGYGYPQQKPQYPLPPRK